MSLYLDRVNSPSRFVRQTACSYHFPALPEIPARIVSAGMQLHRIFFIWPWALVMVATACAGDWPEFRGPTGQGLYDGKALPTQWGPNKNVTWKKPIPGLGWSSPVIVNGKVYLTTAVPQGASHSLRVMR